jgi:hypothetical protein
MQRYRVYEQLLVDCYLGFEKSQFKSDRVIFVFGQSVTNIHNTFVMCYDSNRVKCIEVRPHPHPRYTYSRISQINVPVKINNVTMCRWYRCIMII